MLVLASCNSVERSNEQTERAYVKKQASILTINCDSVQKWFKELNTVNRMFVYDQLGIKDSTVLKEVKSIERINVVQGGKKYEISRTDITNQKTTWSIYYIDFMPLLFMEIKPEDPNSTIYLSKSKGVESLVCSLIADSNFILNKLKITEPIKFIPPSEW